MTAFVEPPRLSQRVLARVLRTSMILFFRGLIRPAMPIAGQRLVLRVLTKSTITPRGVRLESGVLAGRACEWQRPEEGSERVMLYFHGGGYLIGSPATHRAMTGHLAKRGKMAVCALDYRLAPEHPFPAGLDDAVAAYQALFDQGCSGEQIMLGGDSAGGNLALGLVLRIKRAGLPMPAALVCFSPLTDASLSQLHQPPAGDPLLSLAWITQAGSLFCPPGIDRRDPFLSPVYADLTGLPPMLVQVGEDEVLLNDSLRLAERATAAGVDVHLQRYPGCWHVFQAHAGLLDIANVAMARVGSFIQTHFAAVAERKGL